MGRDDLRKRSVVDLGCGTGRLAIGAALLGAGPVVGVEVDPEALDLARGAANRWSVDCRWVRSEVGEFDEPTETVLTNPPFGAQTRHADRPLWDRALALGRRAVYAFAHAKSRTFIARFAVARGARIEERRPVRWDLPATFPHHRKAKQPLAVDLWILRKEPEP